MAKNQMKTLLTVLSAGFGALLLFNIFVALVIFFPQKFSFARNNMAMNTGDTAAFDKAIDEGINRYIANQQAEQQKAQEDQQKAASEKAKNVPGIQADDHLAGNRNAEIVLIEYSDFECPFCQRFHSTAKEIAEKNPDIAWVYRQFPLSIHPGAPKKAEASECVAKLSGNDAFWKFRDALFEAGTNYPVDQLGELASKVGVDQVAFQKCLDSGEMASKVSEDMQTGSNAGVSGTPGNFVMNTKTGEVRALGGAVPASVVEAAIKELSE